MGDSDDEHDRSRERDKFRRERSDYGSGDKGRSSRSDSYRERRSTWREERRRSRDEYDSDSKRRSGGYGRGRDWSPPPPPKRARRAEWDSLRDYSGPSMLPYGMRPPPWPLPPPGTHPPGVPPMIPGLPRDSPSATPQNLNRHMMQTFKQFLTQQDDSIDEDEAITLYNEYKADFKRKQVDEFFDSHKEEDWFLSLYHPTMLATAKEEATAHLQSRLAAFSFLLESGRLEGVPLYQGHTGDIVKVMDTAVIMMEGSEADLAALEVDHTKKEDEEEEEGKDGGDTGGDKPAFRKEQSEDALELAEQQDSGKVKNEDGSDSDDSSLGDVKVEPAEAKEEANEQKTNGTCEQGEDQGASDAAPPGKPRPLHLTHSVYVRHIPPKVSAEDIVKVCKTFPGFLRVAFAEASADKGYERRGWVTYSHGTDIKDVCTQLGNMKVKECVLSCSVNRDLTRRVKHAPPATWTRKAVHSDLHMAIELIRFLDKKTGLWEDEGEQGNPVLYIDESLLREEEEADSVVMEVGEDEEGAIVEISSTDVLDENNKKLKVLERLLWYLRLVHSLDYYNGMVFPSEDNMPHRCGIFTVRSKLPLSITTEDLTRYCEDAKARMMPLVTEKKLLTDAEMEKYNHKDPKAEADKFIEANTQKISENKYLCPLSGKKFKGPEFVKKHIFNKHMDKVEAVKKEAEFFNNYLRDVNRPMPLEASIKSAVPPNPKTPSADESPTLGMISPLGGAPAPVGVGAAWGQEAHIMQMFGRGGSARGFGGVRGFPPGDRGHHRGRGGRGRRRHVIDYQDLDAPDEIY